MVLTAKEWGWSPTAIVRGADNPHKHHPADYNFAHAVATLLEEKCPACGVPIWYAFSTDSSVGFKLKDITCYACEHKESQTKDQDKKPGVSQVVYAVPEDGFDELPSRGAYYERAAKEHQREHELELKRKASQNQ
jgi:uncharacterized Zn finger protein (UPF0148 family)